MCPQSVTVENNTHKKNNITNFYFKIKTGSTFFFLLFSFLEFWSDQVDKMSFDLF